MANTQSCNIDVPSLTVLVRTCSLSEQVRIAERQSACAFTGLRVSRHVRASGICAWESEMQALVQPVCPESCSPCCRRLCHIPPAGPNSRRVSTNLPQHMTNPTSRVQQATIPRRSVKTASEAMAASKGQGTARLSS